MEPRPVSRGELTEVGAGTRSYSVETVMRMAPVQPDDTDALPLSSQVCVAVRLARQLGTNTTAGGAIPGNVKEMSELPASR